MSLATAAQALLEAAGVSTNDILKEAGVDRKGAIKALASELGVNLNDLVDAPAQKAGQAVEVNDVDQASVRAGLAVLNRCFNQS